MAAETVAATLPPNMKLAGNDGTVAPPSSEPFKMGQPENCANTGEVSSFVPCDARNREMGHVTRTGAWGGSGGEMVQIRIFGTDQQVRKILDYIRFTGATYQIHEEV